MFRTGARELKALTSAGHATARQITANTLDAPFPFKNSDSKAVKNILCMLLDQERLQATLRC